MTLDSIPEINESAVDALVQSNHTGKPSDDWLLRVNIVRGGRMDGCVKRYWAVKLDAVPSGDR